MKHIRAFALFVAAALFVSAASAQQFRVDPLFGESATAKIETSQEGYPSHLEMPRFEMLRAVPGALMHVARLEAVILVLFGENIFGAFNLLTSSILVPTVIAQYFSFRLYSRLLLPSYDVRFHDRVSQKLMIHSAEK